MHLNGNDFNCNIDSGRGSERERVCERKCERECVRECVSACVSAFFEPSVGVTVNSRLSLLSWVGVRS